MFVHKKSTKESFLYVPLEAFYGNVPHELIEEGIKMMFKENPGLVGQMMKG